jgi:hypothetical protein
MFDARPVRARKVPHFAGSVRRCGRPETLKSNMTDAPSPESLANLLQQDLRLLASSAAEQRAWAAAQAVQVPPDEMRLSFLDEVPGLMYVYVENGYVDAQGEAALFALERLLNSPTDDEGLRPWTDWDAVVDSPTWGRIRVLAAQALELLRIQPKA